jgi:hypothetical protein
MPAESHHEAAVLGDVLGDNGGADLVHVHAAVGFGNLDRGQAEFAGLLQQFAGERPVFFLQLVGRRCDFLERELRR